MASAVKIKFPTCFLSVIMSLVWTRLIHTRQSSYLASTFSHYRVFGNWILWLKFFHVNFVNVWPQLFENWITLFTGHYPAQPIYSVCGFGNISARVNDSYTFSFVLYEIHVGMLSFSFIMLSTLWTTGAQCTTTRETKLDGLVIWTEMGRHILGEPGAVCRWGGGGDKVNFCRATNFCPIYFFLPWQTAPGSPRMEKTFIKIEWILWN